MSPDARLAGWVDGTLPGLLPSFLQERRWFGGKSKRIVSVRVEDVAWLPRARTPLALVIVDVGYADGVPERYSLLLGFVQEPLTSPVIGRVEEADPPCWAVEASSDGEAGHALLHGFTAPGQLATVRGGSLAYAEASESTGRIVANPAEHAIRPTGAEQSNTSLRVGRTLVFKLFRRLEHGENPELEVGRFLATRPSFHAIAHLRGSLTWTASTGGASTVGILQDWVPNHGDGWGFVVTELGHRHDAAATDGLLGIVSTLGATTADLHRALASDPAAPAFSAEEVTAADTTAWERALGDRAARAATLARASHGWPDAARQAGASLPALLAADALPRAPQVTAPSAAFSKIRVHGDYHLGQTLRVDDGFVIVDFEGEPSRPLAERRRKHCALKDVAGMIRSFDYAVETARKGSAESDGHALSAERFRHAFLEGYLGAASAGGAVFLPRDRDAVLAWVRFFELEKALYELEYEVDNRPGWVHIPLGGVLRLLRTSSR